METRPARQPGGGDGGGGTPWVHFAVFRVPFFLEPDYPEEETFEESNEHRLERKWGGRAEFQAQKRRHRLKERGQEVGIESFNLQRTASNTVAAHCLVQWAARTAGLSSSEALYDELNQRHFVQGRKLNDRAMLVDAAAHVGLDPAAAEAWLAAGDGKEAVRRTYDMVQQLGIHSIPTFVVDGGRAVLNGAVHADELEAVFREIEDEVASGNDAARPAPVFGQALGFAPEQLTAM